MTRKEKKVHNPIVTKTYNPNHEPWCTEKELLSFGETMMNKQDRQNGSKEGEQK